MKGTVAEGFGEPFEPWEIWLDGLQWVIVGGESGGGARPMDLAWARWLVEQYGDGGFESGAGMSHLTAAAPDEFQKLMGTRRFRTPSCLHPATPLADTREQIECLRDIVQGGSVAVTPEWAVIQLEGLLARIDRIAARWDQETGAGE
jgi:hypothetical protein